MISILFAAALTAGGPAAADVVAAENSWSTAEVRGDVAFLQRFLSPDYISVGLTGRDSDKTTVIAGAVRRAAEHPHGTVAPMGPSSTVEIHGDLAIVRHHKPDFVGVDVLQRRGGHWIAVFSQHTPVAAAPPAGA